MLTKKFKVTAGVLLAVAGLSSLGVVEKNQQDQITALQQDNKAQVVVITATPTASPSATIAPTKYIKYNTLPSAVPTVGK